MVRTLIIPKKTDVHITVPESYIGKEIEVLLYAREEIDEEKEDSKVRTMAFYKGILTSEEAAELQEYVKKSREEWDSNI
jgi:translation elongation factor EF-G